MVAHVDVLDVLADVGALDVVHVERAKRGHHDVGIHLHHEGDETLLVEEVRDEARLALGDVKDLVVGVTRKVVDTHVGVVEQPLDSTPKVLVEARALGVEHQVLAVHLEEALVVRLGATGQRVWLVPLAVTLGGLFDGVELVARGVEVLVVDVVARLHDHVAQHLYHNREQVGAHPVEGHAAHHVEAQEEREGDGEAVGHVLLGAGLLALQRVDVVGGHAHHDRRERGGHGHDERRAAVLDGHKAKKLGAGGAGIRDGMDDVDQAKEDDHLDG